jgi:cytochrome b561
MDARAAVTNRAYGVTAIVLHWLVAVLVTFNYLYSDGMGRALAAKAKGIATPPIPIEPMVHVWIGLCVLALVVVRLMVRELSGVPPMPGRGWLYTAAAWGHRFLYLMLVAVPAVGLVAWFGGLRSLGSVHEVAANVLMIAAGVHSVMTLWHQLVIKDGALMRMIRPR